jgi:hypothetical protein
MSPENQAGLIVHETFLRAFFYYEDSPLIARYLTGALASNRLDPILWNSVMNKINHMYRSPLVMNYLGQQMYAENKMTETLTVFPKRFVNPTSEDAIYFTSFLERSFRDHQKTLFFGTDRIKFEFDSSKSVLTSLVFRSKAASTATEFNPKQLAFVCNLKGIVRNGVVLSMDAFLQMDQNGRSCLLFDEDNQYIERFNQCVDAPANKYPERKCSSYI